jgi:hypothetical protein
MHNTNIIQFISHVYRLLYETPVSRLAFSDFRYGTGRPAVMADAILKFVIPFKYIEIGTII